MSDSTLRALRVAALVAVAALGATGFGPTATGPTGAGPTAAGEALAGGAAAAPAAAPEPSRGPSAPGPSAGPGTGRGTEQDGDGTEQDGTAPLPGAPGKPARAPGRPAAAPGKPAAAPGRPAIGPVVGAVPARVSQALTRLQGLFRQAADASEAYSASRDMLAEQAAETRRLSTALADARSALARSRDEAGRLARRQYQGRTELSPYLRLLLARDPRSALEQGRLLSRAADSSRATIARLEKRARRADTLASASRRAFDEQRALAERQRAQRDTLRDRLNDVEEVLASLSPEELSVLGAPGRPAAAPAPVTAAPPGSPSASRRRAPRGRLRPPCSPSPPCGV